MITMFRPIQRPQYPRKSLKVAEVQVGDLVNLGWLRIVEVGEENIYFRDDSGRLFFVKP